MSGSDAQAGFAAAKVNLHLHVTGRRADGYRELDSLVVFADVGDRVSAAAGIGLSLALDGRFAGGLAKADNLVLRAGPAGVPADAAMRLTKCLPVASGIGGGSADAAAALRVLCRLWSIDIAADALAALALGLGADVPVCLAARPALMRGVGERLGPVPRLPACGLLLVNPGVGVSTAAVFAACPPGVSAPCELPAAWPDLEALAEWLTALGNDLQAPAITLCPVIGGVLAAIEGARGCRLARMSGSGATCFGLFATSREAAAAAKRLARTGWWSWGGGMLDDQGFTEARSAT